MRIALALLLLLVIARPAAAEDDGPWGPPQPFEPRIEPDTARWVSLGTTAAGLGLSAYLWHHAGDLPEDNGRIEMQLWSIGTGLVVIGVGPATGLLVAGEKRRALAGAVSRPLLVGGGALAAGMGAFVMMWGCFETNDCTGAKATGGAFMGAGALIAAGGLAWAAYDVWDTPRILRRRMPKRPPVARAAVVPFVGPEHVGLALGIVH